MHHIESISVIDREAVRQGRFSVTEGMGWPVSMVDSTALAGRFDPSALPSLTEQVAGLFITGRGVMGYGASTGAAGGMSIRGIGGSPTSGVLVMVDGQPQYMGLMGHPLADSYLSGNVESIEVVRGASSAMFGSGAMGGVVNITTRGMHRDGAETTARLMYGSWNTMSATAGTSMRKNGFTGNISLNRNRSDGHRPDMGFGETGGAARLGYEISERWKISGGIDATSSRSSNPGTVTDPITDNDADITRTSGYIRIGNRYGGTHGTVEVYHNSGRHDINDGYRPSQADTPPLQWFHSRDRMSGANMVQSVSLPGIGSVVAAGAEVRTSGGRSYNNVGIERSNEHDVSLWEAAVWVNYLWSPVNGLSVDGTLRLDHHGKAGLEWVPRLGIVLQAPQDGSPWFTLKASAGKGFRNPTIRELYMFAPSNTSLGAERVMNYDLTLDWTPRRIPLRGSVTLFFIDGSNMIQTVVEDGRPRWINGGRVRNHGVEADALWQAARYLSVAANYTWLAMRYKVTGAPEHKLYVSASYSRPKWGADTGVQYIGRLYTRVAPEAPTQSYVAWNLRAWWNISPSVRLFARAENLLDAHYETMAGYPMPGITVFGGIDLNF